MSIETIQRKEPPKQENPEQEEIDAAEIFIRENYKPVVIQAVVSELAKLDANEDPEFENTKKASILLEIAKNNLKDPRLDHNTSIGDKALAYLQKLHIPDNSKPEEDIATARMLLGIIKKTADTPQGCTTIQGYDHLATKLKLTPADTLPILADEAALQTLLEIIKKNINTQTGFTAKTYQNIIKGLRLMAADTQPTQEKINPSDELKAEISQIINYLELLTVKTQEAPEFELTWKTNLKEALSRYRSQLAALATDKKCKDNFNSTIQILANSLGSIKEILKSIKPESSQFTVEQLNTQFHQQVNQLQQKLAKHITYIENKDETDEKYRGFKDDLTQLITQTLDLLKQISQNQQGELRMHLLNLADQLETAQNQIDSILNQRIPQDNLLTDKIIWHENLTSFELLIYQVDRILEQQWKKFEQINTHLNQIDTEKPIKNIQEYFKQIYTIFYNIEQDENKKTAYLNHLKQKDQLAQQNYEINYLLNINTEYELGNQIINLFKALINPDVAKEVKLELIYQFYEDLLPDSNQHKKPEPSEDIQSITQQFDQAGDNTQKLKLLENALTLLSYEKGATLHSSQSHLLLLKSLAELGTLQGGSSKYIKPMVVTGCAAMILGLGKLLMESNLQAYPLSQQTEFIKQYTKLYQQFQYLNNQQIQKQLDQGLETAKATMEGQRLDKSTKDYLLFNQLFRGVNLDSSINLTNPEHINQIIATLTHNIKQIKLAIDNRDDGQLQLGEMLFGEHDFKIDLSSPLDKYLSNLAQPDSTRADSVQVDSVQVDDSAPDEILQQEAEHIQNQMSALEKSYLIPSDDYDAALKIYQQGKLGDEFYQHTAQIFKLLDRYTQHNTDQAHQLIEQLNNLETRYLRQMSTIKTLAEYNQIAQDPKYEKYNLEPGMAGLSASFITSRNRLYKLFYNMNRNDQKENEEDKVHWSDVRATRSYKIYKLLITLNEPIFRQELEHSDFCKKLSQEINRDKLEQHILNFLKHCPDDTTITNSKIRCESAWVLTSEEQDRMAAFCIAWNTLLTAMQKLGIDPDDDTFYNLFKEYIRRSAKAKPDKQHDLVNGKSRRFADDKQGNFTSVTMDTTLKTQIETAITNGNGLRFEGKAAIPLELAQQINFILVSKEFTEFLGTQEPTNKKFTEFLGTQDFGEIVRSIFSVLYFLRVKTQQYLRNKRPNEYLPVIDKFIKWQTQSSADRLVLQQFFPGFDPEEIATLTTLQDMQRSIPVDEEGLGDIPPFVNILEIIIEEFCKQHNISTAPQPRWAHKLTQDHQFKATN